MHYYYDKLDDGAALFLILGRLQGPSNSFENLIDLESFYTFLVVRHDVSIADFDIYILYRLHFRLTDIANLTGLNASTINTKRKRLFKSIYQREGTTDEIVSFIMEIE